MNPNHDTYIPKHDRPLDEEDWPQTANTTTLSKRDWKAFVKMLKKPAELNDALKEAIDKHNEMVSD